MRSFFYNSPMRFQSLRATLSLLLILMTACPYLPTQKERTKYLFNKSHAIPEDQIAVATFLNCYKQKYLEPEDKALSITTSMMRDGEDILLQIGLKAERPSRRNIKPLNICCVVDKSRSMNADGKIEEVKRAAALLIDFLQPEDTVSLVAFDTSAQLLIPPSKAVDKEALKLPLKRLLPYGGSNIAEGLLLGFKEIERNLFRERINHLVLITDAPLAIDPSTHDATMKRIEEYFAMGISMTTIGLGKDFHDSFLYKLSTESLGRYFVAQEDGAILQAIAEETASLTPLAADKIRLSLAIKPDVMLAEVYGYPFQSEKQLNFSIGVAPRMACETAQTILVRLKVPPAHQYIGTIAFAYTDATSHYEKRDEIILRNQPADEPSITRNLAIVHEAMNLSEVWRDIQRDDFAHAIRLIDSSIAEIGSITQKLADEELESDLNRLTKYRKNLVVKEEKLRRKNK